MLTAPPSALSTLRAVCRANMGLLNQKLGLMTALQSTFGNSEAQQLYQQVCPIVQASMGQHIRHSMDHIDRALIAATDIDDMERHDSTIHYDLRERGGTDEYDLQAAMARVESALDRLQTLEGQARVSTATTPVEALFMLSGDPLEFSLSSTVNRELGFTAHHAIHHMAMVKIIATESLKLPKDTLPADFGRAPSTIVFDNSQQ
eukprot:Nitzschia sp. Nitz4//scaffold168_size48592//40660//41271//NITZ4_007056-RA/size48592-processed-gene-0.41-mRNA-1//-1//CDS//3329538339//1243//frame0